MSHSVLQLRQLMIDLRVSEKNFSECSYLALSTLLKLLHICMIWLSKLIKLSQSVSASSCIWRIMLNEILHNSHISVCLNHFRMHSCDHHVLMSHRDCTSDSDSRFMQCVCISDTWSTVWDSSFHDRAHSVWAHIERAVSHQWVCWLELMKSYSQSSMLLSCWVWQLS